MGRIRNVVELLDHELRIGLDWILIAQKIGLDLIIKYGKTLEFDWEERLLESLNDWPS